MFSHLQNQLFYFNRLSFQLSREDLSRAGKSALHSLSSQFILVLFTLLSSWGAQAQETDSVKNSIKNSKITKEIVGAISKEPEKDTVFNQKSEDVFMPYQGKIIRTIKIDHLGFERTFYNGSKNVKEKAINIGNALHTDTRESVIRQNLFIQENKPLNAYKVSDNERYLRDLEFILDARIEVQPAGTDSVDLVVITRDVFSLGGRFSPRGTNEVRFGIYDANLLGLGQRLEYNAIIDGDRNPTYGQEIIYEKSSIGGTLVNLTMGYSSINTGSSYGDEYESATYLKLDRPLVSPYTRMAGGFELSNNWSTNVDTKPDSLFLKYSYDVYDVWTGYNVGVNNIARNRSRYFVALRWFQQNFQEVPYQEVILNDPRYNDNSSLLTEITFFQQNFYKTRYIYGFGRTEDIPYGYTAHVTAGWTKRLDKKRLYTGGGITKKVVTKRGDFFEGNIQAATFYDTGPEDAALLFSFSWFSRLRYQKRAMVRQYLKASYTVELNRTIAPLLELGNDFGVKGFRADSLQGEKRLGVSSETVFFTKWKLLGFNFAPLVYADLAFLPPVGKNIFYDKPYIGLGTGVRTRNENLIFGTIELRITYYPRVVEDISHFNINVSTNLRVKYSDSFVRPPSFLRVN